MALFSSNKIIANDWLALKPYRTFTDYDKDYLQVANDVYTLLSEEAGWLQTVEVDKEERKELACILTSYFEDFISEIGLWKVFIEHNHRTIGRYVPFYDLTGYDPEYLNPQDLAYLIWHYLGKIGSERMQAPDNIRIIALADRLFQAFEDRIEAMYTTDFYEEFLTVPDDMNFFLMKEKLIWLAQKSYLVGVDFRYDSNARVQEMLEEAPPWMTPDYAGKLSYALMEDYLFVERSSFGALNVPEWFAGLARCSEGRREEIRKLRYRHTGEYTYEGKEKHTYLFRHLFTDQVYRVRQDSVQKMKLEQRKNEVFTLSLLPWNGDWWISGVLMGMQKSDAEIEAYRNKPFTLGWMLPAGELQKLHEATDAMHEAFREFYGADLALFTSEQALSDSTQDYLDFYSERKLGRPAAEARQSREEYARQHRKDEPGAIKNVLQTEDDLGLFFAKGEGTLIFPAVQHTIELMQKSSLTPEENLDLFQNLTTGYKPVFAEYLLNHYPAKNLRIPAPQSRINALENIPYFWRFHHPQEFDEKFPMITSVNWQAKSS
jgi:hypothetical protein